MNHNSLLVSRLSSSSEYILGLSYYPIYLSLSLPLHVCTLWMPTEGLKYLESHINVFSELYGSVFKIEALIYMSLILKGSQVSALRWKGWFKSKTSIQEYRSEKMKLMLNLWMNCMAHVSGTIELSSDSTWLLGGELVVSLYKTFHVGWVLGACVEVVWEVWTKNVLIYWFVKGQTRFSTSWHAKMSLTLHEPI